jgi:hypothetical protein
MGSYKDKTFDPTQKEILAVCETREEAMRTEMFFHEMYDVARNPMFANRAKQTSTGWSTEGTTASEETKQKQREAKTGKESPYKGKKHSEETKQKLREANAGENHPMFGKKLSNETKQKLREAHIGKALSEETKQKLREANAGENHPMFGKKLSNETKQKLREANAGENHPMFGKKLSNETKQKMREASTRKPVLCLETGVVYPSGREAARLLGLNQSSVSRCCNDRSQTCGGYHWTFLEVKND